MGSFVSKVMDHTKGSELYRKANSFKLIVRSWKADVFLLPDENMAAPSTVGSKPKKVKQIIEKKSKRATPEQRFKMLMLLVPHCSIPLRSEKNPHLYILYYKSVDITTVFFSNYL